LIFIYRIIIFYFKDNLIFNIKLFFILIKLFNNWLIITVVFKVKNPLDRQLVLHGVDKVLVQAKQLFPTE